MGVNTVEVAALNKREPVGKGLELVRGTKESSPEQRGNRSAKQNMAAGEGMELERGTKESQPEEKGNRGVNKTRSLEKAWN